MQGKKEVIDEELRQNVRYIEMVTEKYDAVYKSKKRKLTITIHPEQKVKKITVPKYLKSKWAEAVNIKDDDKHFYVMFCFVF